MLLALSNLENSLDWFDKSCVVDSVLFDFFDGGLASLGLNLSLWTWGSSSLGWSFGRLRGWLELGFFFEEFDLVFFHVDWLSYPLVDELLSPGEFFLDVHECFFVTLNDIMVIYLSLDLDKGIHDIRIVVVVITLDFIGKLDMSKLEIFNPLSEVFEHGQWFGSQVAADGWIVGSDELDGDF